MHRRVRVGCSSATVGASASALPEVASDFLDSSGHLNLFTFHILTRVVIVAAHSLSRELFRLLISRDFFLLVLLLIV